jgi:hypothetical protein
VNKTIINCLPSKGDNTDSIYNERTKPYKNNKISSWKEAEKYNRKLSMNKIKKGIYIVNKDGFHEDIDNNYERLLSSNPTIIGTNTGGESPSR